MNYKKTKAINELQNLAQEKHLGISKIEWWLLKFEPLFNDTIEQIDSIPNPSRFPRLGYSEEMYGELFQFEDLFKLLQEISICHRNEVYFKRKLNTYNEVSNNVKLLTEWLYSSKKKSKEQSLFKSLFQDTRVLKNYKLDVKLPLRIDFEISLNELEFKNTLKFLDVIERSDMIEIVGVINRIDDLEVFEQREIKTKEFTLIKPAYKRRKILIFTNDENLSNHLIPFVNGKVELLNDLVKGQKVKIFAGLRGHKVKNGKGDLEHRSYLLGWDIELIKKT